MPMLYVVSYETKRGEMNAHLVAYEYGSGKVWGYVMADSVDQVAEELPEVDIHEAPPTWMTADEVSDLRDNAVDVSAEHCIDHLLQYRIRNA